MGALRRASGFCPSALCCRNPGPLVPVRVAGRIVAIRPRQPAIAAVVQIHEPPRSADAGRVVEIESRHVTKPLALSGLLIAHCFAAAVAAGRSVIGKAVSGACRPSGRHYAAHSPRFFPDPESRGRPCQYAAPGVTLPPAPASPPEPPRYRAMNRHGARTPDEP